MPNWRAIDIQNSFHFCYEFQHKFFLVLVKFSTASNCKILFQEIMVIDLMDVTKNFEFVIFLKLQLLKMTKYDVDLCRSLTCYKPRQLISISMEHLYLEFYCHRFSISKASFQLFKDCNVVWQPFSNRKKTNKWEL